MFTLLFIAFLLTDVLLRLWLTSRQMRHVIKHRDQVPPEFASRIKLYSHQRAADYTVAKMKLSMIEHATEVVVLLGLTLLGGLQFIDIHLGKLIDSEMLRQLALIAVVLATMGVIGLPFSIWRKFKIEARFGFNRVTPHLFMMDTLKALFLVLLFGAPLTAGVLWIMGNTGPAWVIWAWGVWVAFNFLVLWMFPLVIAPMFNKFTPLNNPEMSERIHELAQRCGFSVDALMVMDGSSRSAHGNAYFTGFGKARRIVFFDTLLERLNVDEVEAVLAHELGHFKYKHIVKRMGISFILALAFFMLLGWVSTQVWFYAELGVLPQLGRPNDAMALVLFFLVVPVFTFWTTPLNSWLSRRDEYQADAYAAKQSSADALVSALVKLYDDNAATLTPDPLHSAFYDSHPSAILRIRHLKHA